MLGYAISLSCCPPHFVWKRANFLISKRMHFVLLFLQWFLRFLFLFSVLIIIIIIAGCNANNSLSSEVSSQSKMKWIVAAVSRKYLLVHCIFVRNSNFVHFDMWMYQWNSFIPGKTCEKRGKFSSACNTNKWHEETKTISKHMRIFIWKMQYFENWCSTAFLVECDFGRGLPFFTFPNAEYFQTQ